MSEKSVYIGLRIPMEMKEGLQRAAKEELTNMSTVARTALRRYLDSRHAEWGYSGDVTVLRQTVKVEGLGKEAGDESA